MKKDEEWARIQRSDTLPEQKAMKPSQKHGKHPIGAKKKPEPVTGTLALKKASEAHEITWQ